MDEVFEWKKLSEVRSLVEFGGNWWQGQGFGWEAHGFRSRGRWRGGFSFFTSPYMVGQIVSESDKTCPTKEIYGILRLAHGTNPATIRFAQ